MSADRTQDHRQPIFCSDADYARDAQTCAPNPSRPRRTAVSKSGPFATFYFENYHTMWLQVQEMLRIEKGGAAQIAGELEAYNPLIPQGRELIATLMLEIDDPKRRETMLFRLAGIEESVSHGTGRRNHQGHAHRI